MIEPVSFAKPREHKPRISAPYVPGKHAERFWTPEEDEIMRAQYPVGGMASAKVHLPHRRQSAIYRRAHELGLKVVGKIARNSAPKPTDETIREEWSMLKGKGAVADLAHRFGVKREWLTDRAMKLGLTLPHKKEPPWTAAEDALMARAPLHNPDRASEFFREHGFTRSPSAIMVRAKRIGISRRGARPELSARGAAKILGVDDKWVTARILAGELRAIKREDQRLPQQGGSSWDIEPADLRAYVFENPERIDLRKVDRIPFLALLAGDEFPLRVAKAFEERAL